MYSNSKKSFNKWLLMLCLFFIAPATWANENTGLTNVFLAIPELMRLVTAIAYVFGMVLIMKGIIEFKHFGETRSMYSTRENGLITPLVYLFTGGALLYLPTSVQTMTSTFFTITLPTAYIYEEVYSYAYYLNGFYLIIELIGTIAFIKGFLLLSSYGGGRASQGAFKTAITQIIGGICCINIYTFLQVVLFTFGLSTVIILPD